MQREAEKHPENFIPLKTMLTFNRVRALTKVPEKIVQAVEKS
jgi:hypothetical protein